MTLRVEGVLCLAWDLFDLRVRVDCQLAVEWLPVDARKINDIALDLDLLMRHHITLFNVKDLDNPFLGLLLRDEVCDGEIVPLWMHIHLEHF